MKRGFQAPDDSDLKPFQQECINSTAAAAADESSSSTTIDTALFKKRNTFSDPRRLPVSKYHDDILYIWLKKTSYSKFYFINKTFTFTFGILP